MAELIIGLDAGTSVIKGVGFSLTGEEVVRSAQPTVIHRSGPARAEQDMNELWAAAVATLTELVAAAKDQGHTVSAIGVTAQGDGSWFIGRDGNPVGRAILWLDGRVAPLITRWTRDGTADAIFRQTGTALSNSMQSAQLRWVQEHEPERMEQTWAVVHAKDWVFYRLTGELWKDESDAAHTFYNLERKTLSDEVFERLGIDGWRAKIPPIRPAYANVGGLLSEVARVIGLPPGTPVTAGPFDAPATALGVGAIGPGQAYSSLGTAGIHAMVQREPATAPHGVGHTILLASPNYWVRLFATMACTLNVDWFLRVFFAEEKGSGGEHLYDVLDEMIARVPPGSEGLVYLPYIDSAGERAPFVLPTGRADFFGIDQSKGKEHFLRAIYEGVAYSGMDCYRHFPSFPAEIRMAGGGAKSRSWMQIWAGVSGRPLLFVEGTEFGARGAAVNAAVATGVFPAYEEAVAAMVRVRERLEPDPELVERYARLYPVYEQLRQALVPVWEKRRDALRAS